MSFLRKTTSALLCALLLLGACACSSKLSVPENALPILMYHNIVPDGEKTDGMTVTVSRFREDMQWLIDHDYTFVLPQQLVEGEIPEKPVMVTFDDGYRTNYVYLFPILREMNVKAALAAVVSRIEEEDIAFLSWDMCREMAQSGLVEFGSHTYDLHNFDERGGSYVQGTANGIQRKEGESQDDYADRVWGDLYHSIELLEAELGTKIHYFAYPFGVMSMDATGFVQSHFDVTVTTNPAIWDLDMGLHNMDRITITMEKAVDDFLRE